MFIKRGIPLREVSLKAATNRGSVVRNRINRKSAAKVLIVLCTALGTGALPELPLFAATNFWMGASGDWNSSTNWSTGTLPSANDDVIIDVPAQITVTHSTGADTIRSLLCQESLVLSGGTLTVSNTMQVNNGFTLSGGTLQGATLLQGTNGQ